MSIQELYQKAIAGEISKEKFLYEIRRDVRLHKFITNTMNFNDCVNVLKNKSIIWENVKDESDKFDFLGTIKSLTESAKSPKTSPTDSDYVHHGEFTKGWKIELEKTDDIDKAKAKAIKNLEKDPMYYTRQEMEDFVKTKKKRTDLPIEVKKDNFKDKDNDEKKVKGIETPKKDPIKKDPKASKKPVGVKLMKESLKKNIDLKEAKFTENKYKFFVVKPFSNKMKIVDGFNDRKLATDYLHDNPMKGYVIKSREEVSKMGLDPDKLSSWNNPHVKESVDDQEEYERIGDTYGTPEIKKILDKWDYLGFDNVGEAINTILTEKDWEESYDLAPNEDLGVTEEDLKKVREWRSKIVRTKKPSVNEIAGTESEWSHIISMLLSAGAGATYLAAMTQPAFKRLKDEEKLKVTDKILDKAKVDPNKKKSLLDKIKSKLGLKEDNLPGGKGDKIDPKSIDKEELKKGIKHEKEHTSDVKIAMEIALDHLAEDPKYYTNLSKAGIYESFDWGTLIGTIALPLSMAASALYDQFKNKKGDKNKIKYLKSIYDKSPSDVKIKIKDAIKKLESKASQKSKNAEFDSLIDYLENKNHLNEESQSSKWEGSGKYDVKIKATKRDGKNNIIDDIKNKVVSIDTKSQFDKIVSNSMVLSAVKQKSQNTSKGELYMWKRKGDNNWSCGELEKDEYEKYSKDPEVEIKKTTQDEIDKKHATKADAKKAYSSAAKTSTQSVIVKKGPGANSDTKFMTSDEIEKWKSKYGEDSIEVKKSINPATKIVGNNKPANLDDFSFVIIDPKDEKIIKAYKSGDRTKAEEDIKQYTSKGFKLLPVKHPEVRKILMSLKEISFKSDPTKKFKGIELSFTCNKKGEKTRISNLYLKNVKPGAKNVQKGKFDYQINLVEKDETTGNFSDKGNVVLTKSPQGDIKAIYNDAGNFYKVLDFDKDFDGLVKVLYAKDDKENIQEGKLAKILLGGLIIAGTALGINKASSLEKEKKDRVEMISNKYQSELKNMSSYDISKLWLQIREKYPEDDYNIAPWKEKDLNNKDSEEIKSLFRIEDLLKIDIIIRAMADHPEDFDGLKLKQNLKESYTVKDIEHYKDSLQKKNPHTISHLMAGAPIIIGYDTGNYKSKLEDGIAYLEKLQSYIKDEELDKDIEDIKKSTEGKEQSLKYNDVRKKIYKKYSSKKDSLKEIFKEAVVKRLKEYINTPVKAGPTVKLKELERELNSFTPEDLKGNDPYKKQLEQERLGSMKNIISDLKIHMNEFTSEDKVKYAELMNKLKGHLDENNNHVQDVNMMQDMSPEDLSDFVMANTFPAGSIKNKAAAQLLAPHLKQDPTNEKIKKAFLKVTGKSK